MQAPVSLKKIFFINTCTWEDWAVYCNPLIHLRSAIAPVCSQACISLRHLNLVMHALFWFTKGEQQWSALLFLSKILKNSSSWLSGNVVNTGCFCELGAWEKDGVEQPAGSLVLVLVFSMRVMKLGSCQHLRLAPSDWIVWQEIELVHQLLWAVMSNVTCILQCCDKAPKQNYLRNDRFIYDDSWLEKY